jgi:ribosome-associated heat shock protein Hsp15
MSCRIDKYIWGVRLAKTRSRAANAIRNRKVKLNGTVAKPSREVKLGDEIQIIRNNSVHSYKIIQLLNNRVGAKLVPEYIISTTPETEKEKYRAFIAAQNNYRSRGVGKPTKKERRDQEGFMDELY